jgi:hypothetical protein
MTWQSTILFALTVGAALWAIGKVIYTWGSKAGKTEQAASEIRITASNMGDVPQLKNMVSDLSATVRANHEEGKAEFRKIHSDITGLKVQMADMNGRKASRDDLVAVRQGSRPDWRRDDE